jgi:RNA polymerase sigma-70 factor, ECF subfamily
VIDSDEALVKRAQSGDRRAFEELLARTWRLVYARLYPDLADRAATQDLVQETYLLAWKRISQLDDAARFRPWLTTIAQSVLIDHARRISRKKRNATHDSADALDAIPASARSPLEQATLAEERQRVLQAMRDLPERYRTPLMLRYLMDADYDAIASQLALSNGALRGLLHRGLAMLRMQLKEHETADGHR